MRIPTPIDAKAILLSEGWSLLVSEAGAHTLPSSISWETDTIPANVPGTAAAALESAGRFDRNDPPPLINRDIWYRRSLSEEKPGPATLRFEGLATIAEAYLDDRPILSSESMFESHDVDIELSGGETLYICFRAMKPHLEKSGPRARWRPRLMNNQGLRLVRTTALGFMPGWCPEVHAVGPWRPVSLFRPTRHDITDLSVSATLSGNTGILGVSFLCEEPAGTLRLCCDGRESGFEIRDGRYSAELHLPDIKLWWPHTHGEPALHDVMLKAGDAELRLARTGFRSISIDDGVDGDDFAVSINGEEIFCRGAVWTSADIVTLPGDRKDYEPWLRLAQQAGMNMIRIPGIGVYESPEFFSICDELGLMVWQDLMFANFDYPATDPDFMIHVKSEIDRVLTETRTNPSLAIICGGSEIWQQGAMMGLPERIWKGPFCNEVLPELVSARRPDLHYVGNSPCGGNLPFFPNAGIAHYYGVGAYRRPLEDARRANVRFAAECLAFSNLSGHETLAGGKAGIPRDAGADWDFEDVRDYYLGLLYAIEPQTLRIGDFRRYLELSRAVTGEVMEATLAEWRRPASTCGGALAFTLQDVMPGPGWGMIGVDGRPKPAWFAWKRACRPVQAVFSDEGTNGIDIHLLNETASPVAASLEITCLRDGRIPVVSGRRELDLPARGTRSFACTDFFGAFFDTGHAYRFGPPSHDIVIARLADSMTGGIIAEAFHFPLGRAEAMHDADIAVELFENHGRFWLELSSNAFAQSVSIQTEGFMPDDNWFHLAPGHIKHIALSACKEDLEGRPSGTLCSLGSGRLFRF